MKDIRLVYFDSEIRFSTYLLIFFRMIGLYVHETVIQTNAKNSPFRARERRDLARNDKDVINIVILNNEKEYISLRRFETNQSVFLLPNEMKDLYAGRAIIHGADDSNLLVLKKLIKRLAEEYNVIREEHGDLLSLAHIYDNNLIMETTLGTRFFVPNIDSYEQFCPHYTRAINCIENYQSIDPDSVFAQFAMAYLAYEYNYYCKRLNLVFYYDVDSIFCIMEDLAEQVGEEWDSLILLFAQIYDDLLEKKVEALEYYNKVIERSYNAFAWYKVGYIYKDKIKNYTRALNCFNNAIQINPMYYRAMFQVGSCQYKLKEVVRAKESFICIIEILFTRIQLGILRPMEAQYLYKTYIILAKMEYEKYGDIYRAIYWYKEAEKLWLIMKTSGGKRLLQSAKYNKNIISNQFAQWIKVNDVSDIRKQIIWLYECVEDTNGIKEYKLGLE